MEKVKGTISRGIAWLKSPRGKKTTYLVLVVAMVGWVIFRFAVIGAQNRLQVFNAARDSVTNGVPVSVIEMQRGPGIVREPLTVQNNRAYVSGARAGLLRPGMRVGAGEIVSVASNIDLDTGMHVVRTRGVPDGLQYAEFHANGYFVPVSATSNSAVYVLRDGVAVLTPVTIARQDTDTAYITSGLHDGDIVILSRVADGDKVNVKE